MRVDLELGINHQSPLIYWDGPVNLDDKAGNQSPIPFDILSREAMPVAVRWESITNPL